MESDVIAWLEKLLNERDRRYEARFNAQEKAVDAAFKSSQTAIDKAEASLERWKLTTNEFRGQLEDQANTFMTIKESQAIVDSLRKEMLSIERSISADVQGLRESRSEVFGVSTQRIAGRTQSDRVTGLLIAGAGVVLSTVLAGAALIVAVVK